MATEIKMPQLGESVVEGTITKWLKQEGDDVQEDELLVEVSTDKVDSEVPSSAAGTIQKILVDEGETVKVGTAIALVGDAGESDAGSADGKAAESSEGQPAAAEAPAAEDGSAPADKEQPSAEAEAQQADAQSQDEPEPQEQGKDGAGGTEQAAGADKEPSAAEAESRPEPRKGDTSKRGIISPLVRRLADEHGVNLDDIDGTGTGGRIRKQDVLRFAEQGGARPAAASAEPAPQKAAPDGSAPAPQEEGAPAAPRSGGREELVPWTNIRRRTAEHMAAAARETARAWNAVEVDWTNVVRLRESAKAEFKQREGFNLTYMGFLARALCETLLEMPEVNASFDEANGGNLVKHYVNLGVAVALEGGGLIVPVVKNADEKNLIGIARAVNEVATNARSKKLSPDDLTGGTFTITNPGPFGSIISVPIVPRGQAAILGFEAITKRVVVTGDDSIAIRSIGVLDLSWDHRIIDGAEAARFLGKLKERIETTDFSPELSQYL
jgi:2-oxoglutarate dehydrogenase E2 component (dihydrolipoamide succinyltransferase)